MIAKLIVTGRDRHEAIINMKQALDKIWIKGTKTTLPFFRMLMRHQAFQAGTFTTSFIEKDLDRYHFSSEYEETIAAWIATKLFTEENLSSGKPGISFDQGRELTPWLLRKRLTQF